MYSGKRDNPRRRERDSDTKPRKRVHHEQEETIVEEPLPYSDPADLRNYIPDARTIEHLQGIGIKGLFPIQYSTFRPIHRGLDLRGKDKTGSGKTLAFSLPVIERLRQEGALKQSPHPKFLIVLPTRYIPLTQIAGHPGDRKRGKPASEAKRDGSGGSLWRGLDWAAAGAARKGLRRGGGHTWAPH